MKPFEQPLAAFMPPPVRGKGWRVFVDELVVSTRIGIHAHEHLAPQPVVIDASLAYRCEPSEEGTHAMIDYERYCNRVSEFLSTKTHTRMLETLAVEIAQLSFDEWPALDALTLSLYKPKIREGTRRIGVELDWTRADYDVHRTSDVAG
ncbi:dihydroneopterin aldolase [Paraburkholderia phymatum]|nr:dihydroneopterin aldolase [Paraburkholderia phymatum]